jgi:3-oxoacyl-[acyl-carrier protein] reductase
LSIKVHFNYLYALKNDQMDLGIKNKVFIVTGAGTGLGRAVAEALLEEGAYVIANSRTEEHLKALAALCPDRVEYIVGDIHSEQIQEELLHKLANREPAGLVINAGGPPAMAAMETQMDDWDGAYHSVMRWKIQFLQRLIPRFINQNYGRVVFIESISVKQPVQNLVLSTSFRMAVVGYVKTLSQEIGQHGITLNVLAPGYHHTNALQRVIDKKSRVDNLSTQEAEDALLAETLSHKLGEPQDFASLALWLLSPLSRYITGQTISVDGGISRGVFG